MMITQEKMDVIATYMDDDIREQLHFDLAPCKPEEFLLAYVEHDPGFEVVLKEFNIDVTDLAARDISLRDVSFFIGGKQNEKILRPGI